MPVRKGIILLILLVTAAVFVPFFSILVMAALFATALWPVVNRWEARYRRRKLGAVLVTLGFGLGILLPAAGAVFSTVRAAQDMLAPRPAPSASAPAAASAELPIHITASAPDVPNLGDLAPEPAPGDQQLAANYFDQKLQAVWEWMSARMPIDPAAFQDMVSQATSAIARKAAEIFTLILAGVPVFLVSLIIILIVLYFMLVDGARVIAAIRKNPWFTRKETDRVLLVACGASRSGLLASLASGFAQAILFCIAAIIGGVPNVFLLGTLIFIGSFIPVVGSTPVTVGAAIYMFMNHGVGAGIAFVVVAVIVGTVDNLIRPAFFTGSGEMHPLLALLSALGGLAIFGFSGVFLGPILVVVATEVLKFPNRSAD